MKKNNRKYITRIKRYYVYKKYDGKCAICKKEVPLVRDSVVAHIFPAAQYPQIKRRNINLMLLCIPCEHEYGNKLREMFPDKVSHIERELTCVNL